MSTEPARLRVDPTDHLPLARWYAAKFTCPPGMEYEDIVQAALEGIIEAAARYDPGKARFSTYATWWMRKAVQSAIWRNEVLKIPQHDWQTDVSNFLHDRPRTPEMIAARTHPISLDAPLPSPRTGEPGTWHDVIADNIADAVGAEDCEGAACRALDALTAERPLVGEVTASYILGTRSLIATAREFKISPTRVRTLVAEGLEHLRHQLEGTHP